MYSQKQYSLWEKKQLKFHKEISKDQISGNESDWRKHTKNIAFSNSRSTFAVQSSEVVFSNRHQVFQSVYLCSPRNSISSGKKEQENFLGESDEYLWNKKVFCVHFLYACMRAWVSSLLGRPSDYKFMG